MGFIRIRICSANTVYCDHFRLHFSALFDYERSCVFGYIQETIRMCLRWNLNVIWCKLIAMHLFVSSENSVATSNIIPLDFPTWHGYPHPSLIHHLVMDDVWDAQCYQCSFKLNGQHIYHVLKMYTILTVIEIAVTNNSAYIFVWNYIFGTWSKVAKYSLVTRNITW